MLSFVVRMESRRSLGKDNNWVEMDFIDLFLRVQDAAFPVGDST